MTALARPPHTSSPPSSRTPSWPLVIAAGGAAACLLMSCVCCSGGGGGGGGAPAGPTPTATGQTADAEAERTRKAAEEAARPKPSRANYARVQPGMTHDEVRKILGPGQESASGPGVLIMTWEESGAFGPTTVISITFQDGRVAAKAIAP